MDRVFIDASAIIALFDATQAEHDQAHEWLEAFGDGSLISHVAVVTEVTALLDRRMGAAVANAFIDRMLPSIAVFHGAEFVGVRAVAAYRAGVGRRRPSMTDCLAFETMRELELETAFAFDDHYVAAGFQTVP